MKITVVVQFTGIKVAVRRGIEPKSYMAYNQIDERALVDAVKQK